MEQPHDMFDDLQKEEKTERVKHNANNLSVSYAKNSIADLSKKIDFSQLHDISKDFIDLHIKKQQQNSSKT